MKTIRTTFFATALALMTAVVTAGTVKLDIESQPLGKALDQFARQTGLQLVYHSRVARGLIAPKVSGEMEAEAALSRLLEKSGLRYEFVDRDTVGIFAQQPQGDVNSRARQGEDGIRIALAEQVQTSGEPDARSGTLDQAGGLKLEEIVVTAQKRAQRAFDVPISIVAMSAEELQKRRITNIDELSLAVPGLAVQSSGSYQRLITLRGVSNTAGNSSLIGLYLDEASVTGTPFEQLDLRTYDLDRVEVLRGPQGTLYGEGSAGGTIRFITREPVLDQVGLNADVAASFTEDGAPGQRIEGALNVPLIEDTLGIRVAGTFDHAGGWIEQPAADNEDFNDQNLVNVRVKGLWRVTSQFTASAMAVIHRNSAPPNAGEDADGEYVQTFNLTTTPDVEDHYDLYNLTLTYDAAAVRILNTSSYVDHDKEVTALGSGLLLSDPSLPNALVYDTYQPQLARRSHVFTEELRLSSRGTGPWQWTLGGFYRNATAATHVPQFYFDVAGPPGTPLPPSYPPFQTINSFESWAAFADTSYRLTDRLTLGTGLRYFQDEQEDRSGPLLKGKFHTTNPRFYAQYKLADHVNSYASAAKGFRSGGFNFLGAPNYEPESVWTYELGAKISSERVSADVAVFHSDYRDYQIIGVVLDPPLNITSNAGDARIRGIEWALSWRPAEDWTLSVNGDYVDTEFTRIRATSTAYETGDPLDFFPRYALTVSAQRDLRWNGRNAFVRVDYDQRGRMSFRNRHFFGGDTPWYFSESDVINMLNVNATVQWNDNLSLGIFAQNLLNDRGFTDPFGIEEHAARARPRTYGVQFGMRFD